jgi:DNA-binding MarR family transcriptional regulator
MDVRKSRLDREFVLLSEIHENGSVSQRDLASRAELSLGTVNVVLNDLAERELIRKDVLASTRAVYRLTDEGVRVCERRLFSRTVESYRDCKRVSERVRANLVGFVDCCDAVVILRSGSEFDELLEDVISDLTAADWTDAVDHTDAADCAVASDFPANNVLDSKEAVIFLLDEVEDFVDLKLDQQGVTAFLALPDLLPEAERLLSEGREVCAGRVTFASLMTLLV